MMRSWDTFVASWRLFARAVFAKHVLTAQVITLDEIKTWYLEAMLHEHLGNVSETARTIGVFRSSLQRMLRKRSGRLTPGDLRRLRT